MAQKICNECGQAYSDNRSSCPNCGCPSGDNIPQKGRSNKKAIYIALISVILLSIVSLLFLWQMELSRKEKETKAKAEMLAKELEEQQRKDSIAAVRQKEEAERIAREDSIEAAIAYEEQQRIEEENRIRREGVQKTIRLNCSVYENERFDGSCNVSGYIYDVWTATISTHICRVPQGKVWIYKGYHRCEEMKKTYPTHRYPILYYYTKENEGQIERRGGSRVYYANQTIELDKGGVPLLRPGDGISIRQQFDKRYPGEYYVEIYFIEKDEEQYY